MCGIFGFTFEDRKLLEDMGKSLAHRGPDSHGFYTDSNISLGHRRLSIIDLSENGKQPMSNEEGDVILVCNGEIYNHAELRKEAESLGHRFHSNSDSEVIIHLYEEYGESLVKKLRGMYAFAIYDSRKGKLILAVDRIGIKPLYYSIDKGKLIFASEVKAILKHKKYNLDGAAVSELFTYQYVNSPRTLFEGISKVNPSEVVVFDMKSFQANKSKYWELDANNIKNMSEEDCIKLIENKFSESVKLRLMSDVPVGIYLSGGLDSSYLTSVASSISNNIKTFTIGFGHETDETGYARKVAEHCNTDHKEVIVDDPDFDVMANVTWNLDKPAVDIASIPLYIMAKESKKYLTVALMGDGGDEVFGGYDKYKFMLMLERYRKVPRPLRKPLDVFLGRKFGSESLSRLKSTEGKDKTESYLSYTSTFTEKERGNIFSQGFPGIEDMKKPLECLSKNKNILQSMMYCDFKTMLPNDYLLKVDSATMAHAVEARVPYLDHEFVEAMFTIPPGLKINGMKTKYIFRKAISSRLPREIVERKKRGFTLPTEKFMREGLKEMALQAFDTAPKGILNPAEIKKIIENYDRNRRYYTRQFWTVFSFILWYKMYFESETNMPRKLDHYFK